MGRTKGNLGTPFEDSKETTLTGRGLMPWEQKVADERTGRRKFHGAFTGGFQAGYKNTCGSEIGFTPAQFTSSRSNRQQVSQDVAQFMDAEDAEEIALGSNLVPREDFQSLRSDSEAVSNPATESMGAKLYRQLAQSPAPSKKPTYGPTMPIPAYSSAMPSHKSDYTGLGGTATSLNKADPLLPDSKSKQSARIHSIFREEDIEYEEVCGPVVTPRQREQKPQGMTGFRQCAKVDPQRLYPPPVLPKDYNPRSFLIAFRPYRTSNPRSLDPNQRHLILEEPQKPQALFHQFLSPADRERIARMKPFVKSSEKQVGEKERETSTLPFAEDLKKRERLFRFICMKDGKEVGGIAPINVFSTQMMTASQLDKEEAEFEEIYTKLQGPSQSSKAPVVPAITSTRYSGPWRPSAALCQRFNVPEPPATVQAQARKTDTFAQEILPTMRSAEQRPDDKPENPLLCTDSSFRDLFRSIFDTEDDDPAADHANAEIDLRIGSKRTRDN